jgi:hypothetical protein
MLQFPSFKPRPIKPQQKQVKFVPKVHQFVPKVEQPKAEPVKTPCMINAVTYFMTK